MFILLGKHCHQLFVAQLVDLFVKRHDLKFSLQIDFVIVLRRNSIFRRLSVLRHQNDGSLHRRKHRQHEIEENERKGVKRKADQYERVDQRPHHQKRTK